MTRQRARDCARMPQLFLFDEPQPNYVSGKVRKIVQREDAKSAKEDMMRSSPARVGLAESVWSHPNHDDAWRLHHPFNSRRCAHVDLVAKPGLPRDHHRDSKSRHVNAVARKRHYEQGFSR